MKILIGYDGSDVSDVIADDLLRAGLPEVVHAEVMTVRDLPAAVAIVETEAVGTTSVVHGYFERERESAREEAHLTADTLAARLRARFPKWSVDTHADFGSPHRQLLSRARQQEADLLVVGSHGRGALKRLIFGSVARACLHHATCSLRIARRPIDDATEQRPLKLLLATDGSELAKHACNVVAARRWPAGTVVRVVSLAEETWVPIGGPGTSPMGHTARGYDHTLDEAALRDAEAAAEVLREAGLTATATSFRGDPKYDLHEDAARERVDSIFLGARGHSLAERMLVGSVAAAVAMHAHCTVEIVRPEP